MNASAVMLVSIMVCQSCHEALCAGSNPRARPALFTRTSTFLKSGGRFINSVRRDVLSVRSQAMMWQLANFDNRVATDFNLSRRRAISTSFAFSVENRSAIASPIPLDAPVTSTTLYSFFMVDSLLYQASLYMVYGVFVDFI